MTTNNEHKLLRRRMARLLGRSISGAAWALACDQGYVAEALDPAYDAAGEDSLSAYLTALLRVEDAGLRSRARSRRSSSRRILTGGESSARVEAVSRLAAEHAAGDEEILRFRHRVLGRNTPMSAEQAEAYLDLPEARERPGLGTHASGPMETLKYQNRHVSHDLHVWAGSPLDKLRKLADALTKSYPWEPAQAAAFVLEGLVPLATPFMLRFPQTWHEGRPRRAKLIMEVDLWMPASAVLHAYREVQRKVLPGHNRPVGSQSIELVNFVIQHRPNTWAALLERWNNEHPGREYSDYRSFRYAFERASRSLLHPKYRPWLGN